MASGAEVGAVRAAAERGVDFLEGAQRPEGDFGTRLTVRDVAAAASAVAAFREDSGLLPAARLLLENRPEDDVDSLARIQLGVPGSETVVALLDQQRADGGFGLTGEYESSALDTALALQALVAAGERTAARRALDRLLALRSGAVWGTDGGEVMTTSEASIAIRSYATTWGSSAAIDGALAAAAGWLAEALGAGSTDPLGVRDIGYALAAIAPFAAFADDVRDGTDRATSAQEVDGSWGDPFTTAVVLRALDRAAVALERIAAGDLPDPMIRTAEVTAAPAIVDRGDDVTVRVPVRNSGGADAENVTVEFYVGDPGASDEPVATAELAGVPAGGQVVVEEAFAFTADPGRNRLYAVLRTDVASDRDLANNRAFVNVYVRVPKAQFPRTRDWPRAGRDMQRSGRTPNRLHAGVGAEPLWRHRADGAHIVAEGKVYFGEGGQVTARDAQSGELAWREGRSYTDWRYRAPIYNRGFIYTAAVGSAEMLQARTGAFAGGSSGWGGDVPRFHVDVVPADGGYDPVFMYLAGKTWVNNGPDGGCALWPLRDPSGSPSNAYAWEGSQYPWSGDGNMLFSEPCGDAPIAFASDGVRAFMASGQALSSFDPATGRGPEGEPATPLFSVRLPGVASADVPPLVDSLGQVVVSAAEGTGEGDAHPSGRGQLLAADGRTGAIAWTFTTDGQLDGPAVEYRGVLIAVDRTGRVYALNQMTGEMVWTWRPHDYPTLAAEVRPAADQTLAISGRYLYVPHPDGRVYTLDARTGDVLSSTAFPARPVDLAIDDENNAIYVRTADGWLGAYPTHELPTQCGPDPANLAPLAGAIARASERADGTQLTGTGAALERPAFSRDGRVVAFTRDLGEPSYSTGISVRDLDSGVTTELPEQETVDGYTVIGKRSPMLSDDGRYLGFLATQPSVGTHVFVLDRETGLIEPALKQADGSPQLVHLDSTYAPADWQAGAPFSMSGDGRFVAFASASNEIVPGDHDGQVDVFVVDRVSGERTLASRAVDPLVAGEPAGNPVISRDGRFVAFTAHGNLTGETVGASLYDGLQPFVFVFDRQQDSLQPVSVNADGHLVHGVAPAISADGGRIAYVSLAPSLLPSDLRARHVGWEGYAANLFVWERDKGASTFAMFNDAGQSARYTYAGRPWLSDDGRFVAFQNTGVLVKGVTSWDQSQVLGHDLATGKTRQLSYNRWGVSGSGASFAPVVSGDGRRVVFLSGADDLVTGDTNGVRDVFVLDRDREPGGEPQEPQEGPLGPNCPVPQLEVEGYSDLNVTAADIDTAELEEGQEGSVAVTVRNEGEAASDATVVQLFDGTADDGKQIGEVPLGAIPAGQAQTVVVPWNPVPEAGIHTLTVVVDPEQQVFQQDFADDAAAREVMVLGPRFSLDVAPDRGAFVANETATFSTALMNLGGVDRNVRLRVDLLDAGAEVVAELFDEHVGLTAGGEAQIQASWDTLDTSAGDYFVRARLTSEAGVDLMELSTGFELTADIGGTLTLSASRSMYRPGETAQLRALVRNTSANAPLSGATVRLRLVGASGAELGAWALATSEISEGKAQLVSAEQALAGQPPGTFTMHGTVETASGAVLDDDTSSFELGSSADDGSGLSGTLAISPASPEQMQTLTFSYDVSNAGNADVTAAKLRVRLSDPNAGTTLKTIDSATRTIPLGATPVTGTLSALADMPSGVDYQATLHLVLADGTEKPLDRVIFHLQAASMTSGASVDTAPRTGVLVWACSEQDEQRARQALGATPALFVPDRSHSRYNFDPGCLLYMGDERREFLRQLRSGDFNQIWLLGLPGFLEVGLANEIAARVIQGDGLLNSSSTLGFDLNLLGNQSPFGATTAGLLLPGSYQLQFTAGTPFAGQTPTVTGMPLKLSTSTAQRLASTTWGIWPLRITSTIAASNTFGDGKAITIGAAPRTFTQASHASAFLQQAKTAVASTATGGRAGTNAKLKLWIEGNAPGDAVQVRVTLPPGATASDLPPGASVAGGTVTVPFDTAIAARQERELQVKLPGDVTTAQITSRVYYRDPADQTDKPLGDPTMTTVAINENRATAAAAALTALGQITAPNSYERAKLDAIKSHVTATIPASSDPNVAKSRIDTLLADIGTLERSNWTNRTSAWKRLARLVTYAQHDYHRHGGQ